MLYVAGVVAVYAVLAAAAEAGPVGGAQGTTTDLLLAGLAAVVLGLAGVLVSLGAAPRSVELGEHETVVVGRFGHRYRFPGRAELTTTVLRRLPASLLSPVALETVEISGGTSRRTFLLEEGLLQGGPRTGGASV